MKQKKNTTIMYIVLVLIMLVGIGLMLYPTIANWYNETHATKAIATYQNTLSDMSKEQTHEMFIKAQEYNESLLKKVDRFSMSNSELAQYNSILDVTDTGIMAYIEIPKITVAMPIYHGTEETTLSVAIGHLEGTSLPVGGAGTHTALSGHRGLPSAKLFTNLDQLEIGDQFFIHVLDQTHTYQIDQIETVLPYDYDLLRIDPDNDYCTLITCTPYGVNSHRLLVRGVRIATVGGTETDGENAINNIPNADAKIVVGTWNALTIVIWATMALVIVGMVFLLLLIKRKTRGVK